MTGLTARQDECLQAVRALTTDGVPPTISELADYLQTGRSRVHDLLSRLRGRRVISWEPRKARSIQILADAVSPGVLNRLSDEDLRITAAHIAGILASRGGAYSVASAYRNIAAQLLCPGKAA